MTPRRPALHGRQVLRSAAWAGFLFAQRVAGTAPRALTTDGAGVCSVFQRKKWKLLD
jgi:hypothetical protein